MEMKDYFIEEMKENIEKMEDIRVKMRSLRHSIYDLDDHDMLKEVMQVSDDISRLAGSLKAMHDIFELFVEKVEV